MEDEIYKRITAGVAKPKKYKLAIFICGASGTGKTTMRHQFLRDLKIKTTFVYLNLDDIKEVGLEEARNLLRGITNRVIEDGYSIFLDGTCRNKQETVDKIKLLNSKGYKVIVGMVYASLPVVLKRLDERRGQYVSETVAKDIYQHMKKNAESYINIKEIDRLYLYTNETSPNLIMWFDTKNKEIMCTPGIAEGYYEYYFDVSKYC